MVKKIFILILMLSFIPSLKIMAEIQDIDENNTWIKAPAGTIYSQNNLSSSSLNMAVRYNGVGIENGEYVYGFVYGEDNYLKTDYNALFNRFKGLAFYLANNNLPFDSTNYYFPTEDSYYLVEFDYTDGLFEILIFLGPNYNSLDLIDYYAYTMPEYVPPEIMFHFDFALGTFRVYWGNELLTDNIPLDNFENFRRNDFASSSYNMTFASFTSDDYLAGLFTSSIWDVVISSDPAELFEYNANSQVYYSNIVDEDITNSGPDENFSGGVFDAFDRLFIGIGLIDGTMNTNAQGEYIGTTINSVGGMVLLYVFLLILLMYLIFKIGGSSFTMIIVAILLTSLFMFLGYLPLFASIILIGFFVVAIVGMSSGGMLSE